MVMQWTTWARMMSLLDCYVSYKLLNLSPGRHLIICRVQAYQMGFLQMLFFNVLYFNYVYICEHVTAQPIPGNPAPSFGLYEIGVKATVVSYQMWVLGTELQPCA